MNKKFFSLLSFLVALSVIFLIYPTMSAEAFDFALKSSNSNLAKAKLPVPSDEFMEATDIMSADGEYMTSWYDVRPSAEARALLKKGANKGCPYSVAALGYNLVAWEKKTDEGVQLLIQADAENCVYGSILLSQAFWYAKRFRIPNITADEAATYIMQCLSRATELQKYLDISAQINRTIREEVATHLFNFACNFGGTRDQGNFIPPNPSLYKFCLTATRDMYKVLYPKDKELLKSIEADIKAVPDYIFWLMTPMYQKYAENVVAADKLFKNKTVRMTASVLEIGMTDGFYGFFRRPFVLFAPPLDIAFMHSMVSDDDPITVLATFKKSEEEKITELYEGEGITFQGKVSGLELDSIIVMTDCVVIAGGYEGD